MQEALTERVLTVPNDPAASVPRDFSPYQQILLKNRRSTSLKAGMQRTLRALGSEAEFVVFGVVTEYCVRLAAKGLLERGRRVSVVQDAIETLKAEDGQRAVAELQTLGAKFITRTGSRTDTAQKILTLGRASS